jgi:hypothetical protein
VKTDDTRHADRWFLDEPRAEDGSEIDARDFTYGTPYDGPRPANVPIQYAGKPVAFNLAAFDMPVVSERIAIAIEELAPGQVQRFPVLIDLRIPGYEILNVACTEACLDESRTEVLKWKPEDGHPQKVGQYRMVMNLKIDPARAVNRHVLRIRGWEVALLVSERVKTALEAIENLGVIFDNT